LALRIIIKDIRVARTATATTTYARQRLLNLQFQIALRRAAAISDVTLRAFEKGLAERWIEKAVICGLREDNACVCSLNLVVDWDEHDVQLTRGNVRVSVDERWVSETAVEVDACVRLFNSLVNESSLAVKVFAYYRKGVDASRANRELGFKTAEPIKWAAQPDSREYVIGELPELAVTISVADI
jgi:hypothetical protein